MGPNTSTLLSLTPLSGTGPGGQNTLQIAANIAENPSGEPGGMFAQLLSQLIPEQPLAGAVLTENIRILPAETGTESGQLLPLTGNALPLALANNDIAEALTPSLITPIVADTPDGVAETELWQPPEELAPLAMLQSAEVLLSKTTQPATAPPQIARAQPTDSRLPPAQPLLQTTTLPDTIVRQENVRTPLVIVDDAVPVEFAGPLAQQPTVSAVTPENPGIATTTTQLSPQLPAATGAPAKLTLDHPVMDARWGEGLGQRVIWMTENGMGRAQIRLNPPELGPVDVRISVANDEAKVAFTVQHGATREAVESALPRLREMFASQGIDLSDTSVSQHSPDQQQNAGDTKDSSAHPALSELSTTTMETDDSSRSGSVTVSDRLIDTYA